MSFTLKQHTGTRRSPKRIYVPGVREPVHLPVEEFELPTPPPAPKEPAKFSWYTMIAPALMTAVTIFSAMAAPNAVLFTAPTTGLSFIHPFTNYLRCRSGKKKYDREMKQRKQAYLKSLSDFFQILQNNIDQQRTALEHAYPSAEALVEIGMARGKFRRLWYRRLGIDSDFLSLRLGTCSAPPVFKLNSTMMANRDDELLQQCYQGLNKYKKVSNLPFTLSMNSIGSLAVCGPEDNIFRVSQRLLLDALVHHSPSDVLILLCSDRPDAAARWSCYKWLPHTRTLQENSSLKGLNLDTKRASAVISWLIKEFEKRRSLDDREFEMSDNIPYVLTVFDDTGALRQKPELSSLIRWGHMRRMPAIFLGEHALPQIRARVDLTDQDQFRYAETWENGETHTGTLDPCDPDAVCRVARALSSLDTVQGADEVVLPSSVPLSLTVDNLWMSENAVENNWQKIFEDSDLLKFPAGLHIVSNDLQPFSLNLLPAERGGFDAYHTILIGTTGSGKSEFMKSLILSSAYLYPPDLLNYFFLDFKGGAAFDPFHTLPHTAGIVTNLQPELVDRGLVAIKSEIARRQEKFASAQVRDIWAFNQRPGSDHMPHMWLLLDEFAKGLADFPELNPVLDLLVRQGRSLGMYLLLANQDVNSSVDKLLSNVGWRIALKVSRRQEMQEILEEKIDPTFRPGHGFTRTPSGELVEFQAGYAGFKIPDQDAPQRTNEYTILAIEDDGTTREVFRQSAPENEGANSKDTPTEQEKLLEIISSAADEMKVQPARKIYLDPLPTHIPLSEVMQRVSPYRTFEKAGWSAVKQSAHHLHAPLGFLDHVEASRQIPFSLSLNEKDGHLWMVGAVGSGKEQVVSTMLLSLALTHLPEELLFYIIEGGSGALSTLSNLPHTGAVVRLNEKERLERLFDFIERTIDTRQTGAASSSEDSPGYPDILLVVNNVAELKAMGLEMIERIAGFIQGGRVGVHILFVSNLARDLPGKLSSNIARRLVLQQGTPEEYSFFVPRGTAPLSAAMPGRGYWIDDNVAECQIALPLLESAQGDLTLEELVPDIDQAWEGPRPAEIRTLPDVIKLESFLTETNGIGIPIGINYRSLKSIAIPANELPREWVILGETHSGKSNALLNVVEYVLNQQIDWDINALCLRPSPLRGVGEAIPQLKVFGTAQAFENAFAGLPETLRSSSPLEKHLLLLIDDLGAIFDPENSNLQQILDQVAHALRQREHQDVTIICAGQLGEFRTKASSHTLIRVLSQNKTGLCLSQDMQSWGWIGATPADTRPYNKMTFPAGRGYFGLHGQVQLVQTPMSSLSGKKAD